jgi:hypothetical protein
MHNIFGKHSDDADQQVTIDLALPGRGKMRCGRVIGKHLRCNDELAPRLENQAVERMQQNPKTDIVLQAVEFDS